MAKISQKVNYLGHIMLSVAAIASLLISTAAPQIVRAQTGDIVKFLPNFEEITSIKPKTDFPVSGEREAIRTYTVVATMYNSLVGQTDSTPCITANGHDLCKMYEEEGFENTIAANFLPIGAQVRFPELYGDKIFVVRDRMNARYGHGRLDIWGPDYQEARQFGVKRLTMEIYSY